MASYRISNDGFVDLRDTRRVRTPGRPERNVPPVPEAQALSFLLSHSFPGHRRIVRQMNETERRMIQLALWADSVNERMTLIDRVWRSITEPVDPPRDPRTPERIQVVHQGAGWAFPIYLDGEVTRVLPHGGVLAAEIETGPVESGAPDLKIA
jgi:hypothetical protein